MKGREPCQPPYRTVFFLSAHFFAGSRHVARCPKSVGISHLVRDAVLVFTSSTQQMLAVVHHLTVQMFPMFPLHLETLQSVATAALMARCTRCTRQFSSHATRPLRIWKDAKLILPTEHINTLYRVYSILVAGY